MMRAALVVTLCLAACSKKDLTVAECEQLSDHMIEVSSQSAADKASQRAKNNADPGHAELMKQCTRDTSRSQFDCMIAAKSVVAIGGCK